MKKGEKLLEEIEQNQTKTPADRERFINIFAGVYAFGEKRVAELLQEADEKNQKLEFYDDPDGALDRVLYRFV